MSLEMLANNDVQQIHICDDFHGSVAPHKQLSLTPTATVAAHDISTEVNDLSCSSSASTVRYHSATITRHHTPMPALENKLILSTDSSGDCETVLVSLDHVTRAVDFFISMMPGTTAVKTRIATRDTLQKILSDLLEKGFTTIEHVVCAMALSRRLHAVSMLDILSNQQVEEGAGSTFPSLREHSYALTPATFRRAIVGLLRLVAKGHGDIYYSITDMLTAADIPVRGDLVGMTARCEWKLFDALGGNVLVSNAEYIEMIDFLECQ